MDPGQAISEPYDCGLQQPMVTSADAGDGTTSSALSVGAQATLHDSFTLPLLIRDGWDALATQAPEPNPFAERWFIEASAYCASDNEEMRIACVEDHVDELACTARRIRIQILF